MKTYKSRDGGTFTISDYFAALEKKERKEARDKKIGDVLAFLISLAIGFILFAAVFAIYWNA